MPGNRIVFGRPEGRQIIIYYLVLGAAILLMHLFSEKDKRKEAESAGRKENKDVDLETGKLSEDEEKENGDKTEEAVTFYVETDASKRLQRKKKKKRKTRIRRVVFLAFVFSITALLMKGKTDGLEIMINYVGQGECIVINCEGKVIMSDCGSSDMDSVGINQIKQTLLAHGITKIDYLFVSHTDEDHISGIRDLLNDKSFDRIRIERIILGNAVKDDEYYKILELAMHSEVEVCFIEAGKGLNFDDFSLKCIFPDKSYEALNVQCGVSGKSSETLYRQIGTPDKSGKVMDKQSEIPDKSGGVMDKQSEIYDKNEMSLVLEVEYKDFRMLLTGDSTAEAEEQYIGKLKKNYDVLKVAHHGSRFSSNENFLKKVNPRITVISCGINNRYGHPHRELMERLKTIGCAVYRTDTGGGITINVRDGKINVSSYALEDSIANKSIKKE